MCIRLSLDQIFAAAILLLCVLLFLQPCGRAGENEISQHSVTQKNFNQPPATPGLCRVLEFGPDQGLQGQVVDIVRMLLDTESMDQSPEKDPFLELFYDKYVGELINLLIEGAEQSQQHSQEQLDAFRREEQVCICFPLVDCQCLATAASLRCQLQGAELAR